MKKLTCVIIVLLVLCSSFTSIQAQNSNKHDSKGHEQVLDHFMLELFSDEIRDAVANFYNEEVGTSDSILIMYNWNAKDYEVVEIDQTEKGHILENSYVVKFTVVPQKNKILGTDSITFGVEPSNYNPRNKKEDNLVIKMLRYEHKDPPKR
ncbi:DUF3888 domain-containing protein [Bacillus gobiensis]|uniref:DUF3888 domain-containing protein n=1 Tax=Bacillus gobiensis TaxID=1441095 RepID=UPI003D236D97